MVLSKTDALSFSQLRSQLKFSSPEAALALQKGSGVNTESFRSSQPPPVFLWPFSIHTRHQHLFLSRLQEEHREQNSPSCVWCFTGIYAESQAVAAVPSNSGFGLWADPVIHLLFGCSNVLGAWWGSDAVLAGPGVPWCSISWLPESHVSL